LSVIGLISINRLSEFFRELTYGAAQLSKATLAKFTRNASEEVNLEPLIQDLLNGEFMHVDETPIKTTERPDEDVGLETARKTTFNAYIRSVSAVVLLRRKKEEKRGKIFDKPILFRYSEPSVFRLSMKGA
jgi:hypothetical protein